MLNIHSLTHTNTHAQVAIHTEVYMSQIRTGPESTFFDGALGTARAEPPTAVTHFGVPLQLCLLGHQKVSFATSFLVRLSRRQTSVHTHMTQHELWLSRVMTVALRVGGAYSLRITGGTHDGTLLKQRTMITSQEKHRD